MADQTNEMAGLVDCLVRPLVEDEDQLNLVSSRSARWCAQRLLAPILMSKSRSSNKCAIGLMSPYWRKRVI